MKRIKRLAVKLVTGDLLEADTEAEDVPLVDAEMEGDLQELVSRIKEMDTFAITSGGVEYNLNPDHIVWTVLELEDA